LFLQLMPGEKAGLPFAYPPIVAVAVWPLSGLPYAAAALIWAGLSAGLYALGLALLWQSCGAIPRRDRWLAIWISLAFEPFVFECIHGGQISALAFAAVCAAIFLDRRGRTFAAGIALGVLAYKPTLLVLIPLAVLLSRQWKTLLGLATTVAVGALASVWSVGPTACGQFLKMMGTYTRAVGAGDGFPTWKYVDVCSFVRLALHRPMVSLWMVGLLVGLMVLLVRRGSAVVNRPAWAWAIGATLVVNLYVGIYDTVLVAAVLWLMADASYRQYGRLSAELAWLMAAVFVTPWITQPLARYGGVQLYTLVLVLVAIWAAYGGVKTIDREAVSVAPNPPR
jgi:hypothetical protein